MIAPASTGKDRRRRIIVNKTDQTNNGTRSSSIPAERILRIVEIKLIAPIIEVFGGLGWGESTTAKVLKI